MASTALLNGSIVVVAASFSVDEWADLQGRVRRRQAVIALPYCRCPGHLSVSVLSTPFFKHFSSSMCQFATAHESEEHLYAKFEIAAGVDDAGWVPDIESISPSGVARWRADVLATDPTGKRVALEVQRSHSATSTYKERTRRYRAQAIESVWFIEHDSEGRRRIDQSIAAFDIEIGFDKAEVVGIGELAKTRTALREFTRRWLLGWRPATPGDRSVGTDSNIGTMSPTPPRPAAQKSKPRANDLPSRQCSVPDCEGFQLWSSIMETWVCMKCRRVDPDDRPVGTDAV